MSRQFDDEQLGLVRVRHYAQARSTRIRVAPDGTLRVSAPLNTPLARIKKIVRRSRPELAKLISQQVPKIALESGQPVGKSHHVIIKTGPETKVSRHGLQIQVTLSESADLLDDDVQQLVRKQIIAAFRREATSYLPKRLQYLAAAHGFSYSRTRLTHAGSRWGSCSSSGTISLNIALMKLPFELIDYVLIHELAHTQQMNHSPEFWQTVAAYDPNFKQHRQQLKQESPVI